MIRLWLTHHGSVPIREQLSAQLLLGILSRRLKPGERLPSVRDLARRLEIHSNTVSAVYHDLTARGWVEARRGSGVFVKDIGGRPADEGIASFVRAWLEEARAHGYTIDAIEQQLARERTLAAKFVVADPDFELARIMAAEIHEATGFEVSAVECSAQPLIAEAGTWVLVNAGHLPRIAHLLGGARVHAVRLRSMQDVVAGQVRPLAPVLIGVVSRSERIRTWATPLLAALGFSPESVLIRDPAESDWQAGLGACDIVAADLCALAELPATGRNVRFSVVSDQAIAEIRRLVAA